MDVVIIEECIFQVREIYALLLCKKYSIKETDWEFVKRLASHFNMPLVSECHLEIDWNQDSSNARWFEYSIEENLFLSFEEVCKKVREFQEKKLKGEIKYIYFSLLRTKILEYKGEYRVDLYDENWFLDKKETSVNVDLNFLYVPLFDFMRELKEKKNEHGRIITDMDIEHIMLGEVNKFHVLAVEFLKNIFEKFVTIPAYEAMGKANDIKILAGEYMDEAEIIYTQELI